MFTKPAYLVALELTPNDPKALFRRCQALEKLGKVDEAYKDVRLVAHMEPADMQVKETVVRLAKQLEELVRNKDTLIIMIKSYSAYFLLL